MVLCRTKHVSHESISGSLSGNDDSCSEANNSCSDMSEELQTAFREEIEEGDVGGGAAKEKSFSPKKAAASLRGSGRAQPPESEEESSVWQLPRSGHRSHLNFTDIKTKGKQKIFM